VLRRRARWHCAFVLHLNIQYSIFNIRLQIVVEVLPSVVSSVCTANGIRNNASRRLELGAVVILQSRNIPYGLRALRESALERAVAPVVSGKARALAHSEVAHASVGAVHVALVADFSAPASAGHEHSFAVGFVNERRFRVVSARAATQAAVWPEPLGRLRLACIQPHRPGTVTHAAVDHICIPRQFRGSSRVVVAVAVKLSVRLLRGGACGLRCGDGRGDMSWYLRRNGCWNTSWYGRGDRSWNGRGDRSRYRRGDRCGDGCWYRRGNCRWDGRG
jgi:hypothetical protein